MEFSRPNPRNSCGHSWLRGCRVDFYVEFVLSFLARGGRVDFTVKWQSITINVQIRGILQKGNIIKVNAIQFESPAACTSSQNQEASSKCNSSKDHVAHRTQTRRELLIEQAASTLQSIDEDSDTDTDNENEGNAPHIMLPLERYALKQRETVENIKHELQNGTRKLEQFDEKIRRASSQNAGGLPVVETVI